MRKTLFLCLALALIAGISMGQTAGQHRGMYIGVSNTGFGTSAVGEFTAQGQWNIYPTGHAAWPHWGNMWHGTQDVDNQSVLTYALIGTIGTVSPASYAFIQWDPLLPGVLNTLWQTPWSGTMFPANVTNVTLNSNGDLVGFCSSYNQVVLYDRYNNPNSVWKGTTLQTTVGINGGLGGFDWDKLNGGYYLANSRSGSTSPIQNLVQVSADLATSTMVASISNSNVQVNVGGGILENGDWIGSSFTSFLYNEVKAGSGQWTTGPSSTFGTLSDVTPERYSAAKRGYYGSLVSVSGSVQHHTIGYFDATTTPHTVTTLVAAGPLPNVPGTAWIMEAMALYDRDLCTVRTGKGTWDLNIKPDPGGSLGGLGYVVAASLAGGKPAAVLPDGREIFLLPDVISVATVLGPFPPFLTKNIGLLDTFGVATAKLDFSSLGTAANGNVVHFCGLIQDPNHPTGIGWVLEPWAFVIDVLP